MAAAIAIGSLAGAAGAQNHGATPGSNAHTSTHTDVGTVVRPILALRKLGTPVRLDDGRFEQRYQVAANVLFRLESVHGAGTDVRCTDELTESALADFMGSAGFHSELRIRAADTAGLEISATQLASAVVPASGR